MQLINDLITFNSFSTTKSFCLTGFSFNSFARKLHCLGQGYNLPDKKKSQTYPWLFYTKLQAICC